MKHVRALTIVALALAAAGGLCGCGKSRPEAAELDRGRALAAVACVTCHSLPAPAQLPAEEWPYLLAWMGQYLGLPPQVPVTQSLVDKGLVPTRPAMSRSDFGLLQAYYVQGAGADYRRPEPLPQAPVSSLFDPIPLAIPATVISMVAIDGADQTLAVGTSDPLPELLILRRGHTSAIRLTSEPAAYERLGDLRRVSSIGYLAFDARLGQVVDLDVSREAQHVLVDRYPRIADHRTKDFDGDGTNDLMVCGFGEYSTGRTSIWWGGTEPMLEQVLFEESGAVWGDAADFDGDGDLDLVFSIGNNHPRLLAFVNEGGRRFTPRTLVERPVGWGYNRGLVVDWDGDGWSDLVELSGNNLELGGRPIKPQHGVRVLRNEKKWRFKEVLFQRLDGAIDVAAGDFDGNGRIDLAAVAFCPDWRVEFPTTVLLLLQNADGSIERSGIADRYWNRWMRIAAGDADGDGDIDLLLGAAQVKLAIPSEHALRYQELLKDKSSVLLLRNRTILKPE